MLFSFITFLSLISHAFPLTVDKRAKVEAGQDSSMKVDEDDAVNMGAHAPFNDVGRYEFYPFHFLLII